MLHATLRMLVKVVFASLVVGTMLAHIGITPDKLMHEKGLSADHVQHYARRGFDRAWPNLLLGAMIIVPVWLLVYILRPPGQSRSE
jgi:hypothetical protein